MTLSDDLELLHKVPIFRDLTDDELKHVQNITIKRFYRKRTVIFTEGAEKEAVYFVIDGMIKAFKTDENGNEHIVSFLNHGDMFPHTGLFNQNPYPATAEALVDSKLLAIPVRSFELLLNRIPEISIKVMRVMSAKIEELQQKLQQLTGNDVQDRGLAFLVKLAEKHGKVKDGMVFIRVPMTNQEFASAIGTTRETVNRLINQLRKEGILESDRSGYRIKDMDALKSWSHKS